MKAEEAIRRYNALRDGVQSLYEELYGTWWGVKACTGLLRVLNRHPQLPDQPEGDWEGKPVRWEPTGYRAVIDGEPGDFGIVIVTEPGDCYAVDDDPPIFGTLEETKARIMERIHRGDVKR